MPLLLDDSNPSFFEQRGTGTNDTAFQVDTAVYTEMCYLVSDIGYG